MIGVGVLSQNSKQNGERAKVFNVVYMYGVYINISMQSIHV